MSVVLTAIGCVITAILSYVVGEKLHFTQRKREKLEKFENAIDDYYLTAHSMKSNGKENSKYDNFSAMYIIRDGSEKQKWLREHNIQEIRDFYEWLNEKSPGWGNFYNKFKQN